MIKQIYRKARKDFEFHQKCKNLFSEPPTVVPNGRQILHALCPKPSSSLESPRFKYSQPSLDLSIIIPVYNTAKYVGSCLDSVARQDIDGSIEIIVVNDGSTDESLDVIKGRMQNDNRIVLINQDNKGYSGARNTGISQANGKAICFVDSDDLLAQGHLNNLFELYRKGRYDYVSASYSTLTTSQVVSLSKAAKRTHGSVWGRIYNRDTWNDIRFPDCYWFEDTVHAYCIATRYIEGFSDDAGYLYRQHEHSISAKASHQYKSLDTFWITEEMLSWCRKLGIQANQKIYDQTISQFGLVMLQRTGWLPEDQLQALFSASCDLLNGIPEFRLMRTSLGGKWKFVELALRSRKYSLWKFASCYS